METLHKTLTRKYLARTRLFQDIEQNVVNISVPSKQ